MTAITITATPTNNETASQLPRPDSSSELYKLVLCKQWDHVLQRLATHPKEAEYMDDFGLCPLHRACFRDASLAVISALVSAYPEATSIQDKCDFSGLTPLHAACHYCSSQIVAALLQSDASALHKRNTKGQTPLECTCQVYEARLRHHFVRIDQENDEREPGTPAKPWGDIFADDSILLRFWRVACLLLKVQVYGVVVDPHSDELYDDVVLACASAANYVPMVLLELATKLHPEQLSLGNDNNNNNNSNNKEFPLHIALTVRPPSPLEQQTHNDVVVQHILQANPDAASMPNAQNKFPLQIAQQSGRSWNAILHPLLKVYPAALYSLDLHDASYAHIFAKVGAAATSSQHAKREKRNKSDEEAAAVSMLFGMLREYPALMNVKKKTEDSAHGEKEKCSFKKISKTRLRIGTLILLPVSFAAMICKQRGASSKKSRRNFVLARYMKDQDEQKDLSEPGSRRSRIKLWL